MSASCVVMWAEEIRRQFTLVRGRKDGFPVLSGMITDHLWPDEFLQIPFCQAKFFSTKSLIPNSVIRNVLPRARESRCATRRAFQKKFISKGGIIFQSQWLAVELGLLRAKSVHNGGVVAPVCNMYLLKALGPAQRSQQAILGD